MFGLRCVFRVDTLVVPLYIYSFIKLLLPISSNHNIFYKIFVVVFRPVLSAILFLPALSALIICAVYFDLVNLTAKIKYGDKYFEHFKGADSVWSSDQRIGKGIVNALYFLDAEDHEPEEFLDVTTQYVTRILRLHPRLQCFREQFMGYLFFIKSDVVVDEIVTYLDDYNNEEELREVLNRQMVSCLPRDNNFLWDVSIGKRKILHHESGKMCVPILYRFHHSLADGVTLVTLLVTNVVQDGVVKMRNICEEYKKIFKKAAEIKMENKNNVEISTSSGEKVDFLKHLIKIKELFTKEIYFNYNMVENIEKSNALHDSAFHPFQKSKVFMRVNKNIAGNNLLGKLKDIKNTLKVSFNDAFLGVLSATFTEHYVRNKEQMALPKHIITANPYFLRGTDFNELATVNLDGDVVTLLGNKFTVGYLKLPICEAFLDNPVEFIHAVSKETASLKGSLDFQFNYWMFNITASIVPVPLGLPLKDFFDATAIISNMPALPHLHFGNGSAILEMVLCSHHYFQMQATVTAIAYEGKLRVSTIVDRSLVDDDACQVQQFADNFNKYINQIHESIVK